ncbi:4-hydroxyphenylpyruvate dioxygenase [Nocardiopsis sp. ARC36]
MAIEEISYLELYAEDGPAVVEYFTSAFGFVAEAEAGPSTGLKDRRSTALSAGGVRLAVTTPVGGGTVADYLAEHGDGVADIAFGSTDPAAAYRRAVASGSRSLEEPGTDGGGRPHAKVAVFGDVAHSLVPPGRLFPDYAWNALPAPSGNEEAEARVVDHVAVCLQAGTLHSTVETYKEAFGLEYYSAEYISVGEQAMDSIVVRNPAGTVTFTMIEPDTDRKPGQIDRFLDRNAGSGVQHIAFLVDDIISSVEEAQTRGAQFLDTPDAYYDSLSERVQGLDKHIDGLRAMRVLADQDEWGYLLQIFTRSPHPRNSLFYELIQRNDARGFGSANIRALYEAVERSREF